MPTKNASDKNSPSQAVLLVGPNFRVGMRIGGGNFGEIRLGKNLFNNEEVAIKLEPMNTPNAQLPIEFKLYRKLGMAEGIPVVYHYDTVNKYNALVLQLLGPSLEDLFEKCNRHFSVKTVTMLALQLLKRIEYIHSRGIIHRDVKPDNFLTAPLSHPNNGTIYIVDFGLAKEYILSSTGKHIPYREHKNLTGTARYMSHRTHLGIEQSRRDDLEALGYVFAYFLRGGLPWQGLKTSNLITRYKRIAEMKLEHPFATLCASFPDEYLQYFTYCQNLEFSEDPDYAYLRKLFHSILSRYKWNCDWQYDWLDLNIKFPHYESMDVQDLLGSTSYMNKAKAAIAAQQAPSLVNALIFGDGNGSISHSVNEAQGKSISVLLNHKKIAPKTTKQTSFPVVPETAHTREEDDDKYTVCCCRCFKKKTPFGKSHGTSG